MLIRAIHKQILIDHVTNPNKNQAINLYFFKTKDTNYDTGVYYVTVITNVVKQTLNKISIKDTANYKKT